MPSRKRSIRQPAIVQAFAQRLREIRGAKEMTQRDLAAKAEVTLTYISRLEAGGAAPGIDLLERLAQALEIELAELLPPPVHPKSQDAHRKHVKELFDVMLAKAGQETLVMLEAMLSRLLEAPTAKR
jgi:transcriptional regulator with XRE-family HTH domain